MARKSLFLWRTGSGAGFNADWWGCWAAVGYFFAYCLALVVKVAASWGAFGFVCDLSDFSVILELYLIGFVGGGRSFLWGFWDLARIPGLPIFLMGLLEFGNAEAVSGSNDFSLAWTAPSSITCPSRRFPNSAKSSSSDPCSSSMALSWSLASKARCSSSSSVMASRRLC